MALDEYTQSQAPPAPQTSVLISDESEGEWELEVMPESAPDDDDLDMLEQIHNSMQASPLPAADTYATAEKVTREDVVADASPEILEVV